MDEMTSPGRSRDEEAGREDAATDRELSWADRVSELRAARDGDGPSGGRDFAPALDGPTEDGFLEEALERLRRDARNAARDDAARQRPAPGEDVYTERETLLRERCRSLFQRWTTSEVRQLGNALAAHEEETSRLLGRAGLLLDRFERLINQLIRLKARRFTHQREIASSPGSEGAQRRSGLSTRVYAVTIAFLGLVEFFANAPIFSTLLPRDPLTERQIAVIAETSSGWMAGVERVLAQLVLRPDAALLAAGVITFLCVLAHFFGHSLRELVMKKNPRSRHGSSGSRSAMENVVPMVLTGLGLVLVLGVLFQARVILGEVGERRYEQDMQAVSELRRQSGWLRTDGELLEANQLADRGDDMEEAATRLREYATSMSRMTFPILLLNLTLVLAAITAAYFHRRDGAGEPLPGDVYEEDREGIVDTAESTASEISDLLSSARRSIRQLDGASEAGMSRSPEGVARRLESIIDLYRRENAQARGLEPERLAAFRGGVKLGLVADGERANLDSYRRAVADAKAEHGELSRRFKEARASFNRQLSSWEADAGDA